MTPIKSPFAEPRVPTVCPTCKSSAIATASKVADADSYWRCHKCGDVWNPTRSESHRGAQAYPRYRSSR